jgi:hypothetical protein
MGACISICCNKSYHGLELADDVSSHLKEMISMITWGDGYNKFYYDLNKDTKLKIANAITNHVKTHNISTLNMNGYITEYISANIAGHIFHKMLWDTIFPIVDFNQDSILESMCNINYPLFDNIPHEYNDVFIISSIRNYHKKYINMKYFDLFQSKFLKTHNIVHYDLGEQLIKDLLKIDLDLYINNIIDELITSDTNECFNYTYYMNEMLYKREEYVTMINERLQNNNNA